MPKDRMFYAPGVELKPLAEELEQWLKTRSFLTQIMPVENGGLLVQARQEEGWRQILGMSLATNIVLSHAGPNIKVECGQGKWLDKAVVGAVGLLILWPAMIPAAVGAWQQNKLPDEIFDRVEAYLARQPKGAAESSPWAPGPAKPAAQAEEATVTCPKCGGKVSAAAKFCEHCGERIPEQQAQTAEGFCSACGAALSPGAKFCPECGAKQGA